MKGVVGFPLLSLVPKKGCFRAGQLELAPYAWRYLQSFFNHFATPRAYNGFEKQLFDDSDSHPWAFVVIISRWRWLVKSRCLRSVSTLSSESKELPWPAVLSFDNAVVSMPRTIKRLYKLTAEKGGHSRKLDMGNLRPVLSSRCGWCSSSGS